MPWYIESNFGFFSLSPHFLYSYAHALMPIYVIQLFMLASNALSTPCSTYFSQKRSAVHFISCFRLFLVKKLSTFDPVPFVFLKRASPSLFLFSFVLFYNNLYIFFRLQQDLNSDCGKEGEHTDHLTTTTAHLFLALMLPVFHACVCLFSCICALCLSFIFVTINFEAVNSPVFIPSSYSLIIRS